MGWCFAHELSDSVNHDQGCFAKRHEYPHLRTRVTSVCEGIVHFFPAALGAVFGQIRCVKRVVPTSGKNNNNEVSC